MAVRKVREPRIAAWTKPMKKSENESENEEKRR
jgi:ribosomal protein L24E